MVETVTVGLVVTDRAKEIITKKMDASDLQSPIPGLIWGRWGDEKGFNWQIGFYEESDILEGWLFDASSMQFYAYQEWLLDQLRGATLDIVDGQVVVRYDDGTNAPREVPY
ncbi:MAG TPA: hypothetical protein ENJ80_02210 [Gammaproteobacteria bacterium]|nr:hypothetical protein [Gammaproteobacteria bacterium]